MDRIIKNIIQDFDELAEARNSKPGKIRPVVPSIAGNGTESGDVGYYITTEAEFRESLLDFLGKIESDTGRLGGRDGLIDYLSFQAERFQIPFDNKEMFTGLSFDEIVQMPVVIKIIDCKVGKDLEAQRSRVEKDKLEISASELRYTEEQLYASNILPQALQLEGIRLDRYRYDGDLGTEDYLNMRFDLIPSQTDFDILSLRYNELIPSSAIGQRFYLKVIITVTDGNAPIIEMTIKDPEIPYPIAWHNFSDDELIQLAKEKKRLEEIVSETNKFYANQEVDISPLLSIISSTAERIRLLHES